MSKRTTNPVGIHTPYGSFRISQSLTTILDELDNKRLSSKVQYKFSSYRHEMKELSSIKDPSVRKRLTRQIFDRYKELVNKASFPEKIRTHFINLLHVYCREAERVLEKEIHKIKALRP